MFERYAVFYTPPPGPLADFGASWLGWDAGEGVRCRHPEDVAVDVAGVTATPRKYGIHATLKAPFVLAEGVDLTALNGGVAAFARAHAPVRLDGLELAHRHGFVALRPMGDQGNLRALTGQIVRDLDRFRAALSVEYIARRRRSGLSQRQDAQMMDWGYPYIFDDFHFHITLSGTLSDAEAAPVIAALDPLVAPLLPAPFTLDAITLVGEDGAGMFHHIERHALTG